MAAYPPRPLRWPTVIVTVLLQLCVAGPWQLANASHGDDPNVANSRTCAVADNLSYLEWLQQTNFGSVAKNADLGDSGKEDNHGVQSVTECINSCTKLYVILDQLCITCWTASACAHTQAPRGTIARPPELSMPAVAMFQYPICPSRTLAHGRTHRL